MKISIKNITITGITAAAYFAITTIFAVVSYGPLQFRISEIMTLLAFINPVFVPGLVLGCFFSNFFSPAGMIDVVVGTFASFLAVLFISKTKNLFVATLWPTIFCAFIGVELWAVFKYPLVLTTLSVMAGEFVVVTLLGYPIMRILLKYKIFDKINL